MAANKVSSFGRLLSELAAVVEQLAQAHVAELDEAFAGTRKDFDDAFSVPRLRIELDEESAGRWDRGRVSTRSDQSDRISAYSVMTTETRARSITFADEVEEVEEEWEDDANAPIPSDGKNYDVAEPFQDLHEEVKEEGQSEESIALTEYGRSGVARSWLVGRHSVDSIALQDTPEIDHYDSSETRYSRNSTISRNTEKSMGSGSGKNLQPAGKMQFHMRRPWSDHGEFNHVRVSQVLQSEKLRDHRRKRQNSMDLLNSRRSSFTLMTSDPKHKEFCCAHRVIQHPDSERRVVWILLCMVFLMYDLIMVPVDICFGLEDSAWSNAVNICAMIFWTLDIFVQFITGVQLATHVEMRPTQIAKIYAKSYLLFDALVVIPEWISFIGRLFPSGQVGFLRAARFGRLSRVLRVARLLRLLRLRPLCRRFIVKFHLSTVYLQVTQGWIGLCLLTFFLLHLLTCAWYALGNGLDDGWVHANGLGPISTGHAYIISYHWCASRLHGLMTNRVLRTQIEMLLDALLIYGNLICVSFYIGTVTAVCMTRATSKTIALWKYGISYAQRHVVSAEVDRRLVKFLEASHSGGLGEVQAQEKVLLQSLPVSLRQDLLFEARVGFVMVKTYFMDLDLLNERVVRHITVSAMSLQISVEREVIFAYGDGCEAVLFVTAGTFWYAYHTTPADALQDQSVPGSIDSKMSGSIDFRSPNHGRQQEQSPESFCAQLSASNKLTGDAVISEPVLWTVWEHCGSLVAKEDSTALSLDAQRFSEVIVSHMGWCLLHTVRYAKHFVWHLNHIKRPHDLSEFPNLSIGNLDMQLYDGTFQDHFLFISHYKVESGTEATLMRDSLDTFLSENLSHFANNLHTPIFIDSEDLTDLAELQGHVRNSQALVLLLTPGVLTRPWCLIEIVEAVRSNVHIVPVEIQRPGASYQYPDEEFYSRVLTGAFLSKDSLGLLEQEGVSLIDVEQSLRHVFQKIALPFSPHKTKTIREAELRDIWKRCDRQSLKSKSASSHLLSG